MKKVLFVASVTRHINAFHLPYLKYFKDNEYEVHVASNGDEEIKNCDKHFNLEFERSPLKLQNIKAYKKLKEIINKEGYDIIHCHTPVASVITRLAAKKARKRGTRIIYTAHGFHFFKGAPLKNWMLYYPIEKMLSKHTDTLITINEEDYDFVKNRFKSTDVKYIHGIGINSNKFDITMSDAKREDMRKNLSINPLDFLMIYVAELSDRKNQQMLIDAMKIIVKKNDNIKLLLVGSGPLKEQFEKEIRENFLQNNIILLGYRTDIPELLKISDLYVATSKMEGLPINILEAMSSGLPVVATNSRGQRELIRDGENGYIVEVNDVDSFVQKIENVYMDHRIRERITCGAKENIEPYLLENVMKEMKNIYEM